MAFDPHAGALACPFCGAVRTIAEQGSVVEHDLVAGLARAAERGLGLAVRQVRCQECGAEIMFEPTVTATRCSFCGSPNVLPAETDTEQPIRPESLLPFRVDRAGAAAAYQKWLARLWFRPSDLRARAALGDIDGVYVPFWTFDCDVASRWTAEAGYFYYVTETYTDVEDGREVTRERQVQQVRWEPAAGSRADSYDDLLVCASCGVPPALAAKLHTFDTTALVPYSPDYLAGFRAERYAVELREGFARAHARIDEEQIRRCAADVPGDTQRELAVASTLSNLTFKHVLLPLWIAAYRYRDQVHRFVVNGQTGEVQGTAPWSWLKIGFAVLVAIALLLVIVQFTRR
jgi:hypothetical protein